MIYSLEHKKNGLIIVNVVNSKKVISKKIHRQISI